MALHNWRQLQAEVAFLQAHILGHFHEVVDMQVGVPLYVIIGARGVVPHHIPEDAKVWERRSPIASFGSNASIDVVPKAIPPTGGEPQL